MESPEYGHSFWGDGNILELCSGDVWTTMCIYLKKKNLTEL